MEAFSIADDWTQSGNSHRVLPFMWVGSTTLNVVQDVVIDWTDKIEDKGHADVSKTKEFDLDRIEQTYARVEKSISADELPIWRGRENGVQSKGEDFEHLGDEQLEARTRHKTKLCLKQFAVNSHK